MSDDTLFAANVETRTIYLGCDIDGKCTFELTQALLDMRISDPKAPISLLINSCGGEVVQGFAMYDLLKSMPFDIIGTVIGECYSAATFLLQACTYRRILPNAVFMIHVGSSGVRTKHHTEARLEMEEHTRLHHAIVSLYARHSGKTKKDIEKLLAFSTYYNAAQAVAAGFADEIIQTI